MPHNMRHSGGMRKGGAGDAGDSFYGPILATGFQERIDESPRVVLGHEQTASMGGRSIERVLISQMLTPADHGAARLDHAKRIAAQPLIMMSILGSDIVVSRYWMSPGKPQIHVEIFATLKADVESARRTQ